MEQDRGSATRLAGRAWYSQPTIGGLIAYFALSALYFSFVVIYSVNGLFADDWGFVTRLVYPAMGGHLSLSSLWAQHGQHRMFIPNLVMVEIAVKTHDNAKTMILLSAVVFIISFAIFLFVLGSYARRRLTLPVVVACGLLWFSLADVANALWAFQFAWYLILFLLMVLLALLLSRSSDRAQAWRFVLAMVAAVVASYSSAQGLFLWPIGLIVLIWDLRGSPRHWPARARNELLIWILMAAVTTGIYFIDFRDTEVFVDNPPLIIKFILANVGNVFPSNSQLVGVREVLGGALLVASGLVVVRCIQDRTTGRRNPLPICLIVFAILFDLSVSLSRLFVGLAGRYTMANLLIPLALVSFALARLPTVRTLRPIRVESRSTRTEAWLLLSLVFGLIVAQSVVATVYGFHQANNDRQSLLIANRIIVNRSLIPRSKQLCYALVVYGDSGEIGDKGLNDVERDHLSMFSTGPYEKYRSEGLPRSVHC